MMIIIRIVHPYCNNGNNNDYNTHTNDNHHDNNTNNNNSIIIDDKPCPQLFVLQDGDPGRARRATGGRYAS